MLPVIAALVFALTSSQVGSDQFEDDFDSIHGPVVGITLLHRHGARTIDKYMTKDPNAIDRLWPEGIGELTKQGILQHFQQGQWIRKNYRNLIPHDWMNIHNGIKVFSTDWNRTIMSAQAELAGMFEIPHNLIRSWHPLRSYLVPVHTIPESDDALLEVTKECPLLKNLLRQNIKSKRYQHLMEAYKPLAKLIRCKLGEQIDDLDNYQQVNSILSIERGRGLKLGKWVNKKILNLLYYLARISFAAPTWTPQLKRMRGGPMIKEFIKNIEDKILNPKLRGVTIYSAHDTTISAFLNSLNNLFSKERLGPPPFAALVIIEHRQKGLRNFVRILYRCPYPQRESPDCHFTPRVLTIPGCAAVCPLEQLKYILRDFIPADWERECLYNARVDSSNDDAEFIKIFNRILDDRYMVLNYTLSLLRFGRPT